MADDAGPLLVLKVNDAKPYMTVSKAHAGKLRALYCRHSLGGAPLPPEGTPEHAAFLGSTFAMLARYEAMGGAGYQAALGETAFDVLKKRLGGVRGVCVAAQLPLRPVLLGVSGRRRRVRVAGVVLRVPTGARVVRDEPAVRPGDASQSSRAREHTPGRRRKANGRLSFVVVIPAWRDVKAWAALEGSAHRRGEPLVVPAAEHGFCDGAQHCRPGRAAQGQLVRHGRVFPADHQRRAAVAGHGRGPRGAQGGDGARRGLGEDGEGPGEAVPREAGARGTDRGTDRGTNRAQVSRKRSSGSRSATTRGTGTRAPATTAARGEIKNAGVAGGNTNSAVRSFLSAARGSVKSTFVDGL